MSTRERVVIDAGQELAGEQHAEIGMMNARERFGAGEAFALEIDLRLIPDFQPMLAQRLLDIDLRARAAHGIDEPATFILAHIVERPGPVPGIV